jgi:threonine synthase
LQAAVEEWGWTPVSGYWNPPLGSNAFGVDGYKTIAYETVRDLGRAPDVVVVPTSYADGLAGVQRGFEDLVTMGVIARQPRLIAVDPFGAYTRAMEALDPTPVPVELKPTPAFSIATPIATYQGIAALKRSHGTAAQVPNADRIMDAQALLARETGYYAEAASAACLLAVESLRMSGLVNAEDNVLCLGTSTGLKDVEETARRLPDVPVIEPTLRALERAISAGK